MGLFGIFKKDKKTTHRGYHFLTIQSVDKITSDTVKVVFAIPDELKDKYTFKAGQYVDIILTIGEKEERRSYSLCNGPDEPLTIAIKTISKGIVSDWFNNTASAGIELPVSTPLGNFILKEDHKNVVAIAAGSGITPILAIAKSLEKGEGNLRLFYANRTVSSILFRDELSNLKNTHTHWFLSGENAEGFDRGRIDKDRFTSIIKSDLSLLRADDYFICGPEEMILAIVDVLKFFGVSEKKIHYELFTTPVLMQNKTVAVSDFKGTSHIKAILDSEAVEFDLPADGKTILEAVSANGLDAPYSCRGGVCSSCKAKVLKGSAVMTMNYSLTDEEVKEGYILCCQAHPSSEELTVSFDA